MFEPVRGQRRPILTREKAGPRTESLSPAPKDPGWAPGQARTLSPERGAPAALTDKATLAALYGRLLPGAQVRITQRSARGGSPGPVDVTWHVANRPVASWTHQINVSQDGSLDLFVSHVLVAPEYRGYALSARAIARTVDLLRKHSTHPNTRISLGAGRGGGQNGERVGAVVWANYGFDFANLYGDRAERHHPTHAFATYGSRPEPLVFQEAFAKWIDAKSKAGELPDDPDLLRGLKEASTLWRHSWEVANFHVPGLAVEAAVGERVAKHSLGKAFLFDSSTPTWAGVFFVNEPESQASLIQQAYIKAQLEKSQGAIS